MHDLIEALIAEGVTTVAAARLVEADLVEAGAKHAKVDLARLREILRLVRMVVGPYSEEEKADAKAELDDLAALTGAPPVEGESMVERAARAAIMKARAGGELQGEGPTGDATTGPATDTPPAPVTGPAEVAPVPANVTPAVTPAPTPEPTPEVEAKAKKAAEQATGRTVSVKISEAEHYKGKPQGYSSGGGGGSDSPSGGGGGGVTSGDPHTVDQALGSIAPGTRVSIKTAYGTKVETVEGTVVKGGTSGLHANTGGKYGPTIYTHAVVVTVHDAGSGKLLVKNTRPSKAADGVLTEAFEPNDSCLIEAIEPTGKIIDVLAIKAGTSMNGKRYRPAVLREAVEAGLFDGRPSFASEGADHYGARGVKALVGWWDNARFGTFNLPNGKAVEGVAAYYHPTDRNLRETLVEAINGGRPNLIGFSIFGDGPLTAVREGGRMIQDVGKIDVIDSIDPVIHPAAGGQALRLVASMETPVGDENKTPVTPDVNALVEAAMGPIRTERLVESTLAEYPTLADAAKGRIRKLTAGQTLTAESVKALVESEAEYVASFAPAKVTGAGPVIEGGQSQREKLVESIEDVLNGKTHSIRKVYVDLTGDESFTGRTQDSGRLSESRLVESAIVSTTFPKLTQEAMHKRLLAEYRLPSLDAWRKIVSGITTAADFRTQKFVLQGGYGNLPTVVEAAPYLPQTEPGEDDITFPALHKVGGTEDLTLEAIANDDVRVFRRIPVSLARAAKRTLSDGVWSVLTDNPVFPDAANAALFAIAKNNIGAAVLSATSIAAGRLAMQRQTQVTSGERLGIMPKYLAIPADLEEAVYVLLNTQRVVGSGNNDVSFISQMGLQPIVVDHWTDANNWYLIADPTQVDTLEVAFFQGREEPELFVQDEPTNGANFTNDVLTYKIRHIWAVGLVDYRGLYGAIVV